MSSDMSISRESGTILLVEDNSDDSVLTERALRLGGLNNRIVLARDGAEAVEYLFGARRAEGRERPVLVLLDLKLPKVNGLEILERIRADPELRDMPVVVLTSSDEERDLLESHRLGADSYVRKTVDFLGFCEIVRKSGPQWLRLRTRPSPPGG